VPIFGSPAEPSKQEIGTADERKKRKWVCGVPLVQAQYRVDRGAYMKQGEPTPPGDLSLGAGPATGSFAFFAFICGSNFLLASRGLHASAPLHLERRSALERLGRAFQRKIAPLCRRAHNRPRQLRAVARPYRSRPLYRRTSKILCIDNRRHTKYR
jgi:hypothetical protein